MAKIIIISLGIEINFCQAENVVLHNFSKWFIDKDIHNFLPNLRQIVCFNLVIFRVVYICIYWSVFFCLYIDIWLYCSFLSSSSQIYLVSTCSLCISYCNCPKTLMTSEFWMTFIVWNNTIRSYSKLQLFETFIYKNNTVWSIIWRNVDRYCFGQVLTLKF